MSVLDDLWYGTSPRWVEVGAVVTLGPASLAYGAVATVRNRLFDAGLLTSHRLEGARVISVGNLVAGGSGKTPLVIFLAQWALAAGHRVAVLTRGHGRLGRTPVRFDANAVPPEPEVGDEPRLIARKAPGVVIYVDGDRVRSARQARADGCDLLLLDDGFQHRRLARDVDVLVHVAGARRAVLPLGPLREPATGARRASVVWNGPSTADPAGDVVVTAVRGARGPVSLVGAPVLVLAGIARPSRFVETVRRLGADVRATQSFPDHHRFSARELARVEAKAKALGATVVTTEKDAERLTPTVEFVVVETAVRPTANLEALARATGLPMACAPAPVVEEGRP